MIKNITYALVITMLISFKAFSQTPANNECSGAIDLTFGTQVSSSVEFATISGVNSSCGTNQQDVWYKFIAPTSGNTYLYLEGGGLLNYTIYDNCTGTNEIDCGSDGENIITTLQSGTMYYINITKLTLACRGDCDYDFTLLVSENVLSQDEYLLNQFNYYPNLVIDELNINAKHLISKIEIYNALGKKLIVKDINALKAKLNISNLQSGLYFIRVHSKQKVKTLKIIKSIN